MFSTLPRTNFNFSITLILLSANAFDLDQSKILSFGNGLKDISRSLANGNIKHLSDPLYQHCYHTGLCGKELTHYQMKKF